ncbi:hypothetical protein ACIMS2_000676 [Vibrio harveyi]
MFSITEYKVTKEQAEAFIADLKAVCTKHNLALNGVNADSGMYASIEVLIPEHVNQSPDLHDDWGIWAVDAILPDEKNVTSDS